MNDGDISVLGSRPFLFAFHWLVCVGMRAKNERPLGRGLDPRSFGDN